MTRHPEFSLIIPTYNEARLLPRLLDTVCIARQCYRGGPDAIEVIVADNGSTDGTVELATSRGCRVVNVRPRVIAAVRNGGARLARAPRFCFVDADARIHPDTFNAIHGALDRPRVIAGATGVKLERWSLGIAATYVLLVSVVWATQMDTGVTFCRRDDFDAIGGYNERLLLAEDVRFLWDMKRRGWRRGQRLVRLRHVKAIASMRKFDEHGDWHYFPMIWKGLRAAIGSNNRLLEYARAYWYGSQREPRD